MAAIIQAQRQRQQRTVRYRASNHWISVQQEWDIDHPCVHCSFEYLKSVTKAARHICCVNGKAINDPEYPSLRPLPPDLQRIMNENGAHMSGLSARYNAILSLGATGVDNGKGGGWERRVGAHAVTLIGKTYHYLPTSSGLGGMRHFIYDALDSAILQARKLNVETTSAVIDERRNISEVFLEAIFEELKGCNCWIMEVYDIGTQISDLINQGANGVDATQLYATMNESTDLFDVSAVTNDAAAGVPIIRLQMKNGRYGEFSSCDPQVEP